MLIMYLSNFLIFLAFITAVRADVVDEHNFFCRFRVSNVTKKTGEQIRSLSFRPLFDYATEVNTSGAPDALWLGADTGENSGVAEVFYRIRVPETAKIVAVNYLTLRNALRDLPLDHLSFRCSNGTYSDQGGRVSIRFSESYAVTLGSANDSVTHRRISRPVTLERQDRLDCYVPNAFIHPYTFQLMGGYVADGESYQSGCSTVGKCQNGAFHATSRCPPVMFPPTMQSVRKLGQCCRSGVDKGAVESQGCPKDENTHGFNHPEVIGADFTPSRIPWQVRFGRRNSSLKCDGVIVSKNWFLTTKSCLNDKDDLSFIRPDRLKQQSARFRNVSVVEIKSVDDSNPGLDLALAKINLPFVLSDWTKSIQKVNLPWSKAVCENMIKTDCYILLGTEQHRDSNDSLTDLTIAVTGRYNKPDASRPYMERIQKKDRSRPVLLGSGAVSWHDKAYFLVGLYVGNAKTAVAGDKITLKGVWTDSEVEEGNIITVCPFLDAIRLKIGSDDD